MAADAALLAAPALALGLPEITLAPETRTAAGLVVPAITYRVRERVWTLEEPWDCAIGGALFQLPEGTRSNLASVPRILWPLVSSFELGITGPFLHDQLYEYGGRLPRDWMDSWRPVTRAEADRWFKDLMKEEGVPDELWRLGYGAVRLRGASHWRAQP